MTLTPDQLAFFDAFGFIRLPGILKDRIDAIIEAFDQVWAERGGGHNGKRHDHKARSCIVPFIDQHPVLCGLLDDPRVHGVATSILGEDFNYMGSDGNFYTGDTGWHSDGAHKGIRFIKIAFYLDPLTPETGALRVIPGSHRVGDRYSDQLSAEFARRGGGAFGLNGSDLPCASYTVRPGDLMIFDHNTKHAAFGGGSNRRMFTMNLCQKYPLERIEELQDYLVGHARFLIERNVGDVMLKTAGPQRLRHLEQVMANDFKLTAETRRRREVEPEPARG
ncbi:MAG TPA: phytanoyl-CoA dioxygenase family protein [Planctomycetota bacterium]|nr:phytanoyl-CoA dioxygenase family protein [Planctomycetota bacterium]